MATPEAERELVTDAEIAEILKENAAGVGALMGTYTMAEQAYFSAISPSFDAPTYVAVNTGTS
ncbi:MAG: hypothetical protein M3417_10190 [Actinomycetota bacterium]|nr:hypothetical protein [Actinomycetota bacterium]